jgi:hypothetical protein
MVTWTTPTQRINSANDLPNVPITMTDACVSGGIPTPAQQYIPQNGEYGMVGVTNSCNYCIGCEPLLSNGAGFFTSCANGDCSSLDNSGKNPQYARVSYLADATSCCTNGGASTVGNLTCDPKYAAGSQAEACSSVFTTRCNNANSLLNDAQCRSFCEDGTNTTCSSFYNNFCTGDTMLSNADCIAWGEANPTQYSAKINGYCTGTNINTTDCKTALVKYGQDDAAVEAWCQANVNSTNAATIGFCSCYTGINLATNPNLTPTAQQLFERPECYLAQCSSGNGYKFTNMRTTANGGTAAACPNVNNCINSITLTGSADSNLSDINQSCKQSITTSGSSDPTSTISTGSGAGAGTITTATITNPTTISGVIASIPKAIDNWYEGLSVTNEYLIWFILILTVIILFGISMIDFDAF